MKFSSKMDADVLGRIRDLAEREGRTVAAVLTAAATEYLERAARRPAFRDAARDVLDEHAELLTRLAR